MLFTSDHFHKDSKLGTADAVNSISSNLQGNLSSNKKKVA